MLPFHGQIIGRVVHFETTHIYTPERLLFRAVAGRAAPVFDTGQFVVKYPDWLLQMGLAIFDYPQRVDGTFMLN